MYWDRLLELSTLNCLKSAMSTVEWRCVIRIELNVVAPIAKTLVRSRLVCCTTHRCTFSLISNFLSFHLGYCFILKPRETSQFMERDETFCMLAKIQTPENCQKMDLKRVLACVFVKQTSTGLTKHENWDFLGEIIVLIFQMVFLDVSKINV